MKPSCPKCGGTAFLMQEIEVKNANFRHHAITCAACGSVVGTEELISVMYMLDKIAAKLGVRFDR